MRRLAAGALLALACAVATAPIAPSTAATPLVAQEQASTPSPVADAVLTWGVNHESNNRAFAPGTLNFLSAGAVPDPGRGGQNIVRPGVWRGTEVRAWRARSGPVRVEKQRDDGAWAPATFAGLGTAADGSPLAGTTGPFSGHRVVLTGGSGTVDRAAGTASITWPGSFSVVYYSGFTFFTIADVALDVTATRARVRATLSGYAADRDDPSSWTPVAPERVVLADLPADVVRASLLDGENGFTAQPAYRGVRYAPGPDAPGPAQVRAGDDWGAFPSSFLAYMDRVGSSAFWYSSGGSADPHKVPLPLGVALDATAPVPAPEEPPPAPQPEVPQPTTPVNPDPPAPPTAPSPTPAPPAATPAAPAEPAEPGGTPETLEPPARSASPATDRTAAAPLGTPLTVLAATTTDPTSDRASPAGPVSAPTWTWWCGALLLLGAAVLTLLTTRREGHS